MAPAILYFTQNIIDCIEPYISGQTNIWTMTKWVGLLLFAMLFSAGNGFFDGILLITFRKRLNKSLTSIIVNKYRKLDYSCFEDINVHDTIYRMSNSPQEKILNIFLNTLSTITLSLSVLGIAFIFTQITVWFSVAFILIFIPLLWLNFKAMDMMNTLFNSQSIEERQLKYFGGLLNDKAALFELRIFSSVEYILSKWRDLNKKVLDERVKTTIRSQKYYMVGTLFLILWAGFVVYSLIWLILRAEITMGLFISLIGSIGTILGLNESLSRNISSLSQNYLEIEHYFRFLALPEIVSEDDNPEEILNPHIEFNNVHFKYPKTEKQILNGISFKISPKERIAIVGRNGAGKSTIIKLLCKLYKPDSGKITINGTDIKNISQKRLKQIFSVVFQDFSKYSFTLRENISLGNISKLDNDDLILNAISKGLLVDVLKNAPKGINTNIGKLEDDGIDLSIGQWQRLAIARTYMSESSFVIMDEPTASLDPIAECEMYKIFTKTMKNKGCIIISHRLASAKLVDKVIVIDSGIIIEQGTHIELMRNNGLYKSMFASQSIWYDTGETNKETDNENL
jgi:ABC-type multidrug transport system fused ATPase/permease subunit